MVGFATIAALNSFGAIPEAVGAAMAATSRWCLIAAIAAVGVRTIVRKVLQIGPQAVSLIVLETLFQGVLILGLALI